MPWNKLHGTMVWYREVEKYNSCAFYAHFNLTKSIKSPAILTLVYSIQTSQSTFSSYYPKLYYNQLQS